MKMGKYIDYNIALASLTKSKKMASPNTDIHLQLADTIAKRTLLFNQVNKKITDNIENNLLPFFCTSDACSAELDYDKNELVVHSALLVA